MAGRKKRAAGRLRESFGALTDNKKQKDKGRVQQSNFDDYRMLRIYETPKIEVEIIKSLEAPGGIGEPGTSAVIPAVFNAVHAATGVRLRKMSLNPSMLKA